MAKLIVRLQGDVCFVETDKVNDKDFVKTERTTIALGEVTGHHHTLRRTPGCRVMERPDAVGKQGVEMQYIGDSPNVIEHQEHHVIPLDAKPYKVGQINTWEGFAKRAEKVRD